MIITCHGVYVAMILLFFPQKDDSDDETISNETIADSPCDSEHAADVQLDPWVFTSYQSEHDNDTARL